MKRTLLFVCILALSPAAFAQFYFQKISSAPAKSGSSVCVNAAHKRFVTRGANGISMYNNDLLNPVLLDTFNTVGNAMDIAYRDDNIIFVADGTGGLLVFTPQNTFGGMDDSLQFPSPVKLVANQGNYVYAVTQNNWIYTVDVTTPTFIFVKASYYTGSTLSIPEGIFVQGNYLYVAENGADGGFEILDISNPNAITQVSKTPTAGFQYDVFVKDSLAYLYEGDRLQIYNVSTPASPILRHNYTIGTKMYEIVPSNNLVITMGNDLRAYKNDSLVATYAATFQYHGIFSNGGDTIYAVGDSLHVFVIRSGISTATVELTAGNARLTVYPNPAHTSITIESAMPLKEVELFSSEGRNVMKSETNALDISSLATGIYFVHVKTAEGIVVKKVIKE